MSEGFKDVLERAVATAVQVGLAMLVAAPDPYDVTTLKAVAAATVLSVAKNLVRHWSASVGADELGEGGEP